MSRFSSRLLFSVMLCLVVASAPAYALCNRRFNFILRVPTPAAIVNVAKITANMIDHGLYSDRNNPSEIRNRVDVTKGTVWPSYNTLELIQGYSLYRSPRHFEKWEVVPRSQIDPLMKHGQPWRRFVFQLRGNCNWKRQYKFVLRYSEYWHVAYSEGVGTSRLYHVYKSKPGKSNLIYIRFPGNIARPHTANLDLRPYISNPSGYTVLYDHSLRVDCNNVFRPESMRRYAQFCNLQN